MSNTIENTEKNLLDSLKGNDKKTFNKFTKELKALFENLNTIEDDKLKEPIKADILAVQNEINVLLIKNFHFDFLALYSPVQLQMYVERVESGEYEIINEDEFFEVVLRLEELKVQQQNEITFLKVGGNKTKSKKSISQHVYFMTKIILSGDEGISFMDLLDFNKKLEVPMKWATVNAKYNRNTPKQEIENWFEAKGLKIPLKVSNVKTLEIKKAIDYTEYNGEGGRTKKSGINNVLYVTTNPILVKRWKSKMIEIFELEENWFENEIFEDVKENK